MLRAALEGRVVKEGYVEDLALSSGSSSSSLSSLKTNNANSKSGIHAATSPTTSLLSSASAIINKSQSSIMRLYKTSRPESLPRQQCSVYNDGDEGNRELAMGESLHQINDGRMLYQTDGMSNALSNSIPLDRANHLPASHAPRSFRDPASTPVKERPPSRPPKISRMFSIFKRRPQLYEHPSTSQIDSHIYRAAQEMNNPTISIKFKEQPTSRSSSLLSSLSASLFSFGNSSRTKLRPSSSPLLPSKSVNSVNTPLTSVAHTTRRTKQDYDSLSSGSQLSIASSSQYNADSDTASSVDLPRPALSVIYGAQSSQHQRPMSSVSMSQTTSALSNAPPLSGCTCYNRNVRGPCLYHKALPSLPSGNSAKENGKSKKRRSNRLSALSRVSLRSIVSSSSRKSRSKTTVYQCEGVTQSSASVNTSSSSIIKRLRNVRRSSNGNPNLSSSATLQKESRRQPSSIIWRAIERHRIPNTGFSGTSDSANDQRRDNNVIYGMRNKFTPATAHSHCPKSASSPCLPTTSSSSKKKSPLRSMHEQMASTATTQILESADHGVNVRTRVSAINACAEIVPPRPSRLRSACQSESKIKGMTDRMRSLYSDVNFGSESSTRMDNIITTAISDAVPYENEKIPFFQPFHAKAMGSSYVSFHFDLSHLEAPENDNGDGDDGDSGGDINNADSSKNKDQHNAGDKRTSDDVFNEVQRTDILGRSSFFQSTPELPIRNLPLQAYMKRHHQRQPPPPPSPPAPRSRALEKDSENAKRLSFQALENHLRSQGFQDCNGLHRHLRNDIVNDALRRDESTMSLPATLFSSHSPSSSSETIPTLSRSKRSSSNKRREWSWWTSRSSHKNKEQKRYLDL